MLTIRKLSIIIAATFFICLFLLTQSPSSPSLIHRPRTKAEEDTRPVKTTTGKTKEEIEKILESADRPLRSSTDFENLRDHLEYLFPYEGPAGTKFPAYIWQTWKYTPAMGEFDERFRMTEASWTERHPGYIHEVITDEVSDILISHLFGTVPQIIETYFSLPLPILKADYFRYLILLARGGIYADIDTEALRSAHRWLPETSPADTVGLIVGIEADPTREDWNVWYARRIQFCQWVMRAKVGHPVLREVVARIAETTLERKKKGLLNADDMASLSIIEWTGPAVWTDSIFWGMNSQTKTGRGTKAGAEMQEWSWVQFTGITEAKQIGDILVLPITGFSPGIGHMGSQEPDDPHAMVLHHFEGSWKPEAERMIGKESIVEEI